VSRENAEVTQRVIDAFNRRDIDAFIQQTTEDFEWFPALGMAVEGRSFRGREGVESYFEALHATWEELRMVTVTVRDLRESVLWLGRIEGRGRGSGVRVDSPMGAIVDFRDGKVWRARSYLDHGQALKAAELEAATVWQANVEIVREYFAATNRRDFASAMDAYGEDVVLIVRGLLPDGTFSGREAVGRWFGDWFSAFGPGYHFDLEEVRGVGERVFATASHRGSGRLSGVPVGSFTAYAFTVRAGKITRVELYADRADALSAVGLNE
jgi:ketosteroid isomerase-like protein